MSGGHFSCSTYGIVEAADEVKHLIQNNESKELTSYGAVRGLHLPADIIEKFEEAEKTLRRAAAMLVRVDYLVSGDDGDDSFRRRWAEEVEGKA